MLLTLVLLALGLGPLLDYTPLGQVVSLQYLQSLRATWGDVPIAWLLYLLLAWLGAVFGFPFILLTAIAGMVFGALLGTVLALLAGMLAALAGYKLGELLGQDLVMRLLARRYNYLRVWLGEHALMAVLSMRVVVPFAAANLIAGAMRIPRPWYFLGTLLGLLPWVVSIAVVSADVATPYGLGWRVTLVGVALLALGITVRYLQRRLRRQFRTLSRPG